MTPLVDEVLLGQARAGDGNAFAELVEPHRRELLSHCYRILGSLHDAEDIVQEVLVSAWRALETFDGRSLRAWLYRIATNRCLNHLRDESRRPQSMLIAAGLDRTNDLSPSDEPWWLEPYPDTLLDEAAAGPAASYDARESIALSFVAGLQRLPVQQRAVLVLRDVLAFSAAETAEMLDTTTTAVNSALLRARSSLRTDRSPESVPLPRTPAEANVVDRFVDAFQRGDVDQVLAVLTEDARLYMPPEPFECRGSRAVCDFLRNRGFWGQRLLLVPTRANSQPAFAYYYADPDTSTWRGEGIVVLTVVGDRVTTVARFGPEDGRLARFGLPEWLPASDADGHPAHEPGDGGYAAEGRTN